MSSLLWCNDDTDKTIVEISSQVLTVHSQRYNIDICCHQNQSLSMTCRFLCYFKFKETCSCRRSNDTNKSQSFLCDGGVCYVKQSQFPRRSINVQEVLSSFVPSYQGHRITWIMKHEDSIYLSTNAIFLPYFSKLHFNFATASTW